MSTIFFYLCYWLGVMSLGGLAFLIVLMCIAKKDPRTEVCPICKGEMEKMWLTKTQVQMIKEQVEKMEKPVVFSKDIHYSNNSEVFSPAREDLHSEVRRKFGIE